MRKYLYPTLFIGKTFDVRGIYKMNYPDNTPMQINGHEFVHAVADSGAYNVLKNAFAGFLLTLDEETVEALYGPTRDLYAKEANAYVERYRKKHPNATKHELDKKYVEYIFEELLGDLVGGMNEAAQYRDAMAADIETFLRETTNVEQTQETVETESKAEATPAEYAEETDAGGESRYSFAGENAQTANKSLLERAKELETNGATPEDILSQTGWFKGADGKWRFEINDSMGVYNPDGIIDPKYVDTSEVADRMRTLLSKAENMTDAEYDELIQLRHKNKGIKLFDTRRTLPKYYKNDALYNAYPFLKDIKVNIRHDLPNKAYGSYNTDTNTIDINANRSSDDQHKTLIHEIQHAIQQYEGFAGGATLDYYKQKPALKQADIDNVNEAKQNLKNVKQRFRDIWSKDDINLNLAKRYEELTDILFGGITNVDEQALEDELAEIERFFDDIGESELLSDYLEASAKVRLAQEKANRNALSPTKAYHYTAGEIEARDTENRLNMTDEQRRSTFPESAKENPNRVFAEDAGVSEESEPRLSKASGEKVSAEESREKISLGMSDEDRYNALKDRTITVAEYDKANFENLIGDRDTAESKLETLKTASKKEATGILRKLGAEFGIYKKYPNEDIELEFEFTTRKMRESVHKQNENYDDFAKMLSVFDKVITNAVGIEVHPDKYEGTKRADESLLQTYVLISAFGDGKQIVPVRLTVKEFADEKSNKLHVAISLNKIERRIVTRAADQSDPLQQVPRLSGEINISDLFANVKPEDADLLKYVPDGFLDAKQKAAKKKAIVSNKQNIQPKTKAFKQWFGDWENDPEHASKVVNEDGTPKVVYHGGQNEDYTVFDRRKSKYTNLYGRGFYFTDSRKNATLYGDVREFYLDIKNPLGQTHNITKEQLRKFLNAVADNEDYDIWNYGTTDIDSILDSVYGKTDFEMLQDVSATAIGDMVEATELFNKVNGTSYDGFILPSEIVVFDPTQIKSATDNIGTFDRNDPDIRFSIDKLSTQDLLVRLANGISYRDDLIAAAKKNRTEVRELISDNKRLKGSLDNAKRQMVRTKVPSTNAVAAGKVTRAIIKSLSSKISAKELQPRVMAVYNTYFKEMHEAGHVEALEAKAAENMAFAFQDLVVYHKNRNYS